MKSINDVSSSFTTVVGLEGSTYVSLADALHLEEEMQCKTNQKNRNICTLAKNNCSMSSLYIKTHRPFCISS
jgi:hypothetical protein